MHQPVFHQLGPMANTARWPARGAAFAISRFQLILVSDRPIVKLSFLPDNNGMAPAGTPRDLT